MNALPTLHHTAFRPSALHAARFGAGKTTLFADFDGTYMLFDQTKCCKEYGFEGDPVSTRKFNRIYRAFGNYVEKHPKTFEFIITTGRNKWEFLYFVRKLVEQGLHLPLPEKLITKNGGDIFMLDGRTWPYTRADQQKREEIKAVSGWDIAIVKKRVTRLLQAAGIKLITTSPSTNHIYEYGDTSLEAKMRGLKQPGKEAYAAFREDGDLHCFVALPQGQPGADLAAQIEGDWPTKQVNVAVHYRAVDGDDAVVPHYQPGYQHDYDYKLQAGQSINLVPMIKGSPYQPDGPLTKLYDIRKRLKTIIDTQSHDLVVVSGNGSNDETMLNPFNYVDLIGLPKPKDTEEARRFLGDADYVCKMRTLPLVAVVVGNEHSLDHIRAMAEALNTRQVQKIVSVDGFDQTLLDAIKLAKAGYARTDRIFAAAARE